MKLALMPSAEVAKEVLRIHGIQVTEMGDEGQNDEINFMKNSFDFTAKAPFIHNHLIDEELANLHVISNFFS